MWRWQQRTDSSPNPIMANYAKRDERAEKVRSEIAKVRAIEAAPRPRAKPGPPPTLIQEMRAGYRWFWFICARCDRRTPKALAPFAIKYGLNIPTIDVAKLATCQRCRKVG